MFGNVKSLRELFEIQLRYAYDGEKKLVEKGLPTMIEKASSPELRAALQHHLGETRNQVARLERVLDSIGVEPDTKSNDILDKIMSAAKGTFGVKYQKSHRFGMLPLIANGNLVEHYEIAFVRIAGCICSAICRAFQEPAVWSVGGNSQRREES